MSRPTTTTIPNMLEAESFTALRSLMLKKNMGKQSFYKFEVRSPQYEGDMWRAFFYEDVMNELSSPEVK